MKNEKETITFLEFKAWLTGLVIGKKGALPDLEDWKKIKKELDKVEPEKIIVPGPSNPPEPNPIPDIGRPYVTPNTGEDWFWGGPVDTILPKITYTDKTNLYHGSDFYGSTIGNYTTNTNVSEGDVLTMEQLELALAKVEAIQNKEKK